MESHCIHHPKELALANNVCYDCLSCITGKVVVKFEVLLENGDIDLLQKRHNTNQQNFGILLSEIQCNLPYLFEEPFVIDSLRVEASGISLKDSNSPITNQIYIARLSHLVRSSFIIFKN